MSGRSDSKRRGRRHRVAVATSTASMALPAILAGTPSLSAEHVLLDSMERPRAFSVRPVSYSDSQAAGKFTEYGYTYCDAKVMASFWQESSPYDAKVRLGHKMLQGVASEPFVASARSRAAQISDENLPCTYEDGGFSYSDMEVLARAWGRDVWSTKLKVRRGLVSGDEPALRRTLKQARGSGKSKSGTYKP